ncbi:hypothetical protein J2Z69_000166 [Paenibacillus shirakamiensis]|uniref:Uncharacterized protein n=1 Tax=Paenibacillus shirakamiensis TaxID=1265935 RepID=A0ABS4JBR2_9BACL|nr:hypothetical protein [Paenibacillus shirakamiensis]MBP1999147.1 hypothetical protein [Paenibacillus shirakamiensis]
MGEKNILAYFKSPEEAEEAAHKLQAIRVEEISIDRFGKYPGRGYSPVNMLAGSFTSLAAITQDAGLFDASSSIMAAADPAASGMSDGGAGGPTGRDILLTVIVGEETHHQALRIIEDAGGLI